MSSTGIEEINDEENHLKNMSERQAVLYFQHQVNDENASRERANSLLNYHDYFIAKQKQEESKIDKAKLIERRKLMNLGLKEFQSIHKNIYINRKKHGVTEDDIYICQCKPKKYTQEEAKRIVESGYEGKTEEELFGCGNKCTNRGISCECVEGYCPCGASCRNRRFQNQEYANVYPIKTKDRGFGLCAGTFFRKGTFVIQYIGEVYETTSEYGQNKIKKYQNTTCTYLMSLSGKEVIDPTERGNLARFINHSCDPNCETQKWNILGETCIGIFTLRDIEPDEELTFDYHFEISETTFQRCLCGTKKCRGYLGIVNENSPMKSPSEKTTCGGCKQHWRKSEKIVVCETCKQVFHNNCAKRGKTENGNYYCYHCIKKSINNKITQENTREKLVKIEDDPVYDENYEVDDEELGKLRKNLSEFMDYGARLFWDPQQQNAILGTKNKLCIKITGTAKQIENVKKKMQKLKEMPIETNDSFVIKIQVPKIFVRKIIGHQSRNLNSYKSKFHVEINYDTNLITDEIFPLQESTVIEIKGKENNAKAVGNEIKYYLFNLKILTIFLMPTDYHHIRTNICNLKTKIDPADVRLRKREYKNEKDLKHPFYYISNNNKDIVIIGFDKEVEKGEKIINEFILRQNTLSYNYSLSFLFPIYFRKNLTAFLNENKELTKQKNLDINVIEPEYLRRHLSVYIEGKWKDVIEIKNLLWKNLKEVNNIQQDNSNLKRHNISEFEQYAFNQEHKLISKSIKTYILEQNTQLKNWDNISLDIGTLKKKKKNDKGLLLLSNTNKAEEPGLLKSFVSSCDRDTKLNYMLNFPPGGYRSIFNLSQKELAANMLATLSETYESCKEAKMRENTAEENNEVFDASDNWGDDTQNKSHNVPENGQNIIQASLKKDEVNDDLQNKSINPMKDSSDFSQIAPQNSNVIKNKQIIQEQETQSQLPENNSFNISYNFPELNHMNMNINSMKSYLGQSDKTFCQQPPQHFSQDLELSQKQLKPYIKNMNVIQNQPQPYSQDLSQSQLQPFSEDLASNFPHSYNKNVGMLGGNSSKIEKQKKSQTRNSSPSESKKYISKKTRRSPSKSRSNSIRKPKNSRIHHHQSIKDNSANKYYQTFQQDRKSPPVSTSYMKRNYYYDKHTHSESSGSSNKKKFGYDNTAIETYPRYQYNRYSNSKEYMPNSIASSYDEYGKYSSRQQYKQYGISHYEEEGKYSRKGYYASKGRDYNRKYHDSRSNSQ